MLTESHWQGGRKSASCYAELEVSLGATSESMESTRDVQTDTAFATVV